MHNDTIQPAPPPLVTDAVPQPVAPWPHTVALFVVLIASALLGQQRAAGIANGGTHWYRYGSTVMLSWLLLGSVVAGVYHRGAFFAAALRNRASTWAHEAGIGVAVYLCGMLTLALVGGLTQLTPLRHKRNEAVVLAMLPHTPLEFVLWLLLSMTAGFCEELIFRGYLLQQFTAWTRRPVLAVILSSAIFGAVHLYEGVGAMLPLMALALLFGFIARQRKGDLRAVMIAHALQDFLVAILALAQPWLSHRLPHP
ncbi:CPBP family intramembrane metalloprotease [Granulicella sp. WH15]|uniref:CPBP family intramembrane glutamic endopeptidase n=1 Tax=Granulicella sp. WH15 TaxID=2602070 RepID=UPI0013677EAC|nr:type II CAAX endopeptidase family protein [Granulicella sp. WH15]QHN04891.1 CPBP family intramembrane metalloprotease [Granulicella sp. WH15]